MAFGMGPFSSWVVSVKQQHSCVVSKVVKIYVSISPNYACDACVGKTSVNVGVLKSTVVKLISQEKYIVTICTSTALR
jgi:hypothetical protein